MSARPRFALVPIARLRGHEQIRPELVDELVAQISARGVVADPIWVARGSWVVLNGHHRVAALERLGASRVPAYLVDYESGRVTLDRWSPGPPISKAEVVRRARAGELFPSKTTRHGIVGTLPVRPTPLEELLPSRAKARQRRASGPSRSPGAGASGPG